MKSPRGYTMGARAESVVATRDRIARCALALFIDHWYEDVTLAAIAEAAGVSHQTVLNHFESKQGVVQAVAEILSRETTGRRYKAVPGDIRSVVTTLVGEYEHFGDANVRWAVTAERVSGLTPFLDEARAAFQQWLVDMFGDSLPATRPARRRAVNALHAALDVYTWKLLRRDLRLSRDQTERTMAELVRGVLDRCSKGEP